MFNFVLIKKSGKYTLFGILPQPTIPKGKKLSELFEKVKEEANKDE